MVRAGEAGGFLHVVLQQIADFRTRERDLKGRVIAAMIYPCLILFVACGVVVFMLTFFIPKFKTIFADFGSQLPTLTRVVVTASEALKTYGIFVLLGIAAAVFGLRRAMMTDAGRRVFERMLLRTPLIGKVIARFALVRFSRMLGTLVGAGVPLVNTEVVESPSS